MPDDCKIGLVAKGFEVADETITDGNCGIHAFVIGLLDESQRDKVLANTSQLKQVRKLRNNVKEMIAHVRRSAFKWMQANAETVVWDGMRFKDIAVAMAGRPGRNFGDQCNVAKLDKQWIDCSVILAMACIYSVDVIVHQHAQEPAEMGPGLVDKPALARVNMFMINDMHFWGLRHMHIEVPLGPPEPHIVERPIADADEDGDEETSTDFRVWYEETQEALQPRMLDNEVEQELALCKCLLNWDPFAPPSPELIAALQDLRAPESPTESHSHLGLRCLLRQTIVEQLQYEQDHLATLPKRMLNNSAARYRLRRGRVALPDKGSHHQLMSHADGIAHDQIPGVPQLIEMLSEPCGEGHSC